MTTNCGSSGSSSSREHMEKIVILCLHPFSYVISRIAFGCCMGIAVSLNFVVCPHRSARNRARGRKDVLNTWRRVAFKIILRKRAGKIFGQVGNWLKSTKGSTLPIRAEIAKRWSQLGGLLNNYPRKVTGCPLDAEIRQSVLRCARQ